MRVLVFEGLCRNQCRELGDYRMTATWSLLLVLGASKRFLFYSHMRQELSRVFVGIYKVS